MFIPLARAAAVALVVLPLLAQTHKHYDESPAAKAPGPQGQLAPRLQNLGTHALPVSTKNADAQRFVNQGMNLAFAFNHAEARRAFREAGRLDPTLAMAEWGQALVLGPNINAMMESSEEPNALEHVKRAMELRETASPREKALIEALSKRYSGDATQRATNDAAYAAAMREVHNRFPDDPDISMLYVESVMDLRPWGYWMPDGAPHEGIAEIAALTEDVMRRHPKHPGALHLYIHLMEAHHAAKAEAAADTLLTLMPAAGHMVHMPAHIYQRLGRYKDAIRSNELAIVADEDYISQCNAQGLYPMAYYPHNIHFLWFAATFDGQSKVALDAARRVAAKIDDATLQALPITAGFRVMPYLALTRFGRWDEMLTEAEPPANAYLRGMWHYARGLSYVAKKDLTAAERELVKIEALLPDKMLDGPLFSPNVGRNVMAIAPVALRAEMAAARGDWDRAIAHAERAVRLEDALIYTEPSEWHYPPRHLLGALLLKAGRAAEAETVYWEDLRRNRNNGWALFGLAQALEAQTKDATLVRSRFAKAWERADIQLTASRF
jgi:tetratricopeptide (TPR) repeat protein